MLFGDAFAFYPWMIDKDHEHQTGKAPAILGLEDVRKFRGQSSPALFRMSVGVSAVGMPLLSDLLAWWHRRYASADPSWANIALFRSLNMAYHASLLPVGRDATFCDLGRLIRSAFEVPTASGPNALGACLAERTNFLGRQRAFETALLTARRPVSEGQPRQRAKVVTAEATAFLPSVLEKPFLRDDVGASRTIE